jgi:SAM-dependent methyltransferase
MGQQHRSRYLLDREEDEARRRLRLLERLEDPATFGYLQRIGVAPGWRCLEVGGGLGSVAAWLCRRVGPSGRVVATDLEPRFLDELELANLEVRRHDIATDELEREAFDLVHARNVLMHVPRRDEALHKLADAVRPGGWILLEEPDAVSDAPDPTAPGPARRLYEKVVGAIYAFLGARGLDLHLGARLLGELRSQGFESLGSEGHVHVFQGGSDAPRSQHMPAFAELRESVVAAGRVTDEEYGRFLALPDDPSFAWREATAMAAWGRRPR